MEFSGQYLTFDEYEDLGGLLGETPFDLLEYNAQKEIDLRTQGRLVGIDSKEIPLDVKMCLLTMIDTINKYSQSIQSTNNGVASESIDGYSVSYITTSQIQQIIKSKQDELEDIMRTYLSTTRVNGVSLLYLGVN